MRGYVARKGDRWYAVIYEGMDPVSGRELTVASRRHQPGGGGTTGRPSSRRSGWTERQNAVAHLRPT